MSKSAELLRRAAKVFPGTKHTRLPLAHQGLPHYPQFLARGEGSRVVDVDGREYLDLLCGFGASVLGYNHPKVDAAAAAAQQRGGVLTGPTDLSVELAERLVSLRPGADWALMAKNGTDVTSLARTVARATTGKRFILREHAQPSSSSSSPSSSSSSSSPPAAAAYHGASNVWARGSPGVLDPEGAAFEAGYTYNDLASVEAALTQGQAAGDVAAIFVGGCSYMYSKPTVEPTPEFAKGLRALADKHGCLLVVDEIRTNFRVGQSLQGHWADLVAEDANAGAVDSAAAAATAARLAPDLHCLCKALANGHPLAALVGSAASRDAAASVTATGTYWLAPAPMAAALATLDALASNDCAALRHTQRVGSELSTGLLDLAQSHDFAVTMSGPAAMPFLTFDADDDDANAGNSGHHHGASRPRGEAFCAAWASEGVWAHPHHNWYLSAAHSEKDISFALDAADRAFRAVAAMETTI